MSRWWKMPRQGDTEWTNILSWGANDRTNTCLDSEISSSYNNTYWKDETGDATTNAVFAYENATAPDGSLTAAKVTDDGATGTGTVQVYQTALTATNGTEYTVSAFLKPGTIEWIRTGFFNIGFGSDTYFHLSGGGSVGTEGTNVNSSTIEYVGDGWYRITVQFTGVVDESGSINLQMCTGNAATTITRDGTNHFWMWGIQLEEGTSATPYISTTTAARTISGNGRTNVCVQSETFDNASWQKLNASTITANQATAPDGSTTADQWIDDASTGTGNCRLAQNIAGLATSGSYTASIFVKADGLDWFYMGFSNYSTLTSAFFDLTNVAIGTTGAANESEGIEDVGNGWRRCWITFPANAGDTAGTFDIYIADGNGDIVVDLDGTSSLFVWGAQLEEGSRPTGYIPTTTAAVTANQEAGFIDEVHRCLETITEDTGSIDDLYKKYKMGLD